MIRIIALDPGETTGWAIGEWDGESPGAQLVASGTCTGLNTLGRWLKANLYGGPVVVCEAFRLYPHAAQDLILDNMVAAQAIGVIKYLAHERQVPVVEQMASVAKQFSAEVVEERLHATWDLRGHELDAARHTLYYILRRVQGGKGNLGPGSSPSATERPGRCSASGSGAT